MLIFDFFSGTGSSTQAFRDAGHCVVSFEIDWFFDADEHVDVMELEVERLLEEYGRPDFIWASPPCTTFSVINVRRHWEYVDGIPTPKTQQAIDAVKLVEKTFELIDGLAPKYGYFVENPRGMLRKLDAIKGRPQRTISYCQYGDTRMKPTDLWGDVKTWRARPMCAAGDDCHESAPRGSGAGTVGMSGGNRNRARKRAMVPKELGQDILEAIERNV